MNDFPLTVTDAIMAVAQLPAGVSSVVFYHYTNWAGFEGILKSGGLRAAHRWNMNDEGEFRYARTAIDEVLDEVAGAPDPSNVSHQLVRDCRAKLRCILTESVGCSRAYCACVSINRDQERQWQVYSQSGRGFALGFNLFTITSNQRLHFKPGAPFLFCGPVRYRPNEQKLLIRRFFEAAIHDVQRFAACGSRRAEDQLAFYKRILCEVLTGITVCVDFIKDAKYEDEREIRIMRSPNDGTFNAQEVEYCERNGVSVPFLFFDLRDRSTGRLPLEEIIVGPNATRTHAMAYVGRVLDDNGYCKGTHSDRPRILQSSIETRN